MAYSDNFPATRPVFMADFANGGKIDPRATFSRASTGSYFGTEKVLSSENLLLQSQDFDTTWGLSYMAAPTGSQTAPDGTSTAWLLTCNIGTNVGPRIFQSYTATASTEYTAVAHLKAGTATHGYLSIRTNSGNYYAGSMIDFSAGTIAVTSAGMTDVSGTVTALGSDWFKVTIKATSGSSLTSPQITVGVSDGSAVGGNGRPVWSPVGTETMYAWGVQLSTTGATVYDSPTTTQIARSYQTKLQTAASGAARFEHSATDGQSEGILIEGSSTNLYPYGSDQSNWSGARRLVQSNVAISPAGTLTADLVTLNGDDANTHYVFQYLSVTSGTTYTISQYVKAAGLNYIALRPNTGFASNYVYFDLSNGTVISNTGGLGATIDSIGNGWYRVSVTATANATVSNATCAIYYMESSSSLVTATGDSFRGILLWGAQWEASSFASSLVDTGTGSSQLTRAADSLSVATADIGYTGGPFTIVSETEGGTGFYPRAWTITDGTVDNRVGIHRSSPAASTSTNWLAFVVSDGSTQASSTTSSSASADKLGVSVDTNDVVFCASGSTFGTDGSAVIPDGLTTIYIGANYAGGQQLNGHYKRFAIYNEALSDTNLQALTS